MRFGCLSAITVILAILYSQELRAHPTDFALPIASYQDDAEYETIPPPEPSTDAGRDDLRSAIQSDPELAAVVREEAEMMIAAQLSGIPRPRYIPATSLVDLKGLEVYASRNHQSFPFSFYLNGFVQVRWFEFARSVESWTASGPIDGKGGPPIPTQYPVNNINVFEINRFFLTSEGYITDERLRYSLTLFGTTNNGNNSAIAPLGFARWKFNDQVMMSGGVSFVAATREWGTSSRWVQGIDRSMANTFFRPSYSPGFEFKGKLLDGEFRYRGGVWNGIDGSRAGVNRSGTAMAWAGIVAWEPLGTYGPYYSDMEVHRKPVFRLGCSGMHALTPTSNQSESFSNPEDTLVRLSNGTPISAPGAIQANTKITRVRVQLATVDIGWKYQGTAINFEYYFRLLDDYSGQNYSSPPRLLQRRYRSKLRVSSSREVPGAFLSASFPNDWIFMDAPAELLVSMEAVKNMAVASTFIQRTIVNQSSHLKRFITTEALPTMPSIPIAQATVAQPSKPRCWSCGSQSIE
ncbi:MAG TPA: hypothetical protein DEB70_13375 [Planctomycetaceae bacterium]|nr:hypothetical protein [Planctomycetaceae bacterium]